MGFPSGGWTTVIASPVCISPERTTRASIPRGRIRQPRMKTAAGIALAAAVLFGAAFLLKPAPTPVARPRLVAPSEPAPVPPEIAPAKSGPIPERKVIDPRGLLADLSRALRVGDEKAIREILDKLRDLLLPPVPDDQNAALPYVHAFTIMGSLIPKGDERKAYEALLMGNEPGAEDLKILRGWLGKRSDVLAEVTRLLREAADRPQCRFPQDEEWGLGSSHAKSLVRISWAANLLSVQAALARLDGNPRESAESVRAGLALARAPRSDPAIISQMIACAVDGVGFDSAQRGGFLGASRLASLVDALDPASFRDAYSRAIVGDVVGTVSDFLKWRADPSAVEDEELRAFAQNPLAVQDLASFVERVSAFTRLLDRPYGEVQVELEGLARKSGEEAPWYARFSKMEFEPGLMRAVAQSEARLSLVKMASELERWRAREGGYPATLDALGVPTPRDPFSGQPFVYRREGDGFTLEPAGEVPNKEKLTWRAGR